MKELARDIASKLIERGFQLSDFDNQITTDEVVWILSVDHDFFNLVYDYMLEIKEVKEGA